MLKEAETLRLPERYLALIDRVAAADRARRVVARRVVLRVLPPAPHAGWRQTFISSIRHVAQGARVLEYGAIPLLMTAALAALDFKVSALDLSTGEIRDGAIGDLGLDVMRCDVETEVVPFADATFDVVLFNELFEHLRINPVFTMREVHRVLKPGGVLLLSTPNLRSFRGIRNLIVRNQGHAVSAGVYRQYEKLETLGHMGHVREYTTREVSDLLTRIGFRVEKIIYRGGHGRGVVGLAERLAPSMRPFFTVLAARVDAP